MGFIDETTRVVCLTRCHPMNGQGPLSRTPLALGDREGPLPGRFEDLIMGAQLIEQG